MGINLHQKSTALRCFLVIWLTVIFLSSSSFLFARNQKQVSQKYVSLMAYNVLNLFDATDDGDAQGDPTFLPFSVKKGWGVNKCLWKQGFRRTLCEDLDWTQDKYEERLRRVANVLIDYDGGADIVVLEELENRRVIYDLWDRHLRWKGYRKPIHFESPSNRGIDVGMVSRFPLKELPIAHTVDLSGIDPSPTRDVIEATFQVARKHFLKVAANHWPSLDHVVQARLRAAEVTKKIALKAQREGIPFVAMGDFNTLPREVPNPIEKNISDDQWSDSKRPLVDIPHYVGHYPNSPGEGSHFYKGDWSPLDRILVSKDFFHKGAPFRVDVDTFGVFAPSYLLKQETSVDPVTGESKTYSIPHRYDFLTDEGYSDHLPVVLKVVIR